MRTRVARFRVALVGFGAVTGLAALVAAVLVAVGGGEPRRGMFLGYLGEGHSSGRAVTWRDIPVPVGTVAGDVLVVEFAASQDQLGALGAPAGWRYGCGAAVEGVAVGVWWRVAQAQEPGRWRFTAPAGSAAIGYMWRYAGIDPVEPFGRCRAGSGFGLRLDAPGLDAAGGDRALAVWAFTHAGNVPEPPSGYVQRTSGHTGHTGMAVSAAMADRVVGGCSTPTCPVPPVTAGAVMLRGEPRPHWVGLHFTLHAAA